MSQPEPAPIRVTLRPARPGDAARMAGWRGEASVRRFQPLTDVSAHQIRSELAAQRVQSLYAGRGDRFQWIVLADGEPAGWITLVVTNWAHGLGEIGYALTTEWQRRGVMPLALEQLLADLFLSTDLERIEARCAIDNLASQAVLETLGFRLEGRLRRFFVLRGQRVDNLLYAILREDWLP